MDKQEEPGEEPGLESGAGKAGNTLFTVMQEAWQELNRHRDQMLSFMEVYCMEMQQRVEREEERREKKRMKECTCLVQEEEQDQDWEA